MEKYALVEREFQFGQGTNCKTTNTQWKNQNTPRNSFFLFIPCVFYTRGQKEQMKIPPRDNRINFNGEEKRNNMAIQLRYILFQTCTRPSNGNGYCRSFRHSNYVTNEN